MSASYLFALVCGITDLNLLGCAQGMCKNLVEKGDLDSPLLLYNRSVQRATDLSGRLPAGKTQVVESLDAAAAKADIIFTCLADDEAVRAIIESIIQGDVKGKLFVDCSTIHPETTDAIAKLVASHGAEFVAAPVFGPPALAEAGQLIGVLAGPKPSVERARPYFKGVMAKAEVLFANEPYGKATTLS
jgi:3-hydroxyisobutyrate dehydrogenase-like beta-hydroxyacid dehydrogenase